MGRLLEYQVQHTVTANGFNIHYNTRLIAVNPSRMQMNDILRSQVWEGAQMVVEKIQAAIGQNTADK